MDSNLEFVTAVRMLLAQAASLIQPTPDEEDFLEQVLARRLKEDGNPFVTAKRQGLCFSPRLTVFLLFMYCYKWNEHGSDQAILLDEDGPPGLEVIDSPDAGLAVALWSAVRALAWSDPDRPSSPANNELALAVASVATEAEAYGAVEVAYDLLSCAVGLIDEDEPALADIAGTGLRLALEAQKPAQIAVMSAKRAVAAVAEASADLDRRLEAYDIVEIAIERIAAAETDLQRDLAEIIYPSLSEHDWLSHLRVRLMPYVVSEETRDHYRELLGVPDWPPRIARLPFDEAAKFMPGIFHLLRAEVGFENERLRLSKRPTQNQVTTDPVDWTFKLNDYARAVPHSSSLLRERQLGLRLSLLTHEVTHVLSFLGDIGGALIALRVAGITAYAAIMASGRPEGEDFSELFASGSGLKHLISGDMAYLLPAEKLIQIRRKSQILVDAWTPWLEGLAVYGELGADPELDPIGINPVTACLRNLVDFFYDETSSVPYRQQVEHQFKEFEQKCGDALRSIAPSRLELYLNQSDGSYFTGYVAVRAIVSRWRSTIGKNLSSAEIFDVLLHATRFGTDAYIPKLALEESEFARETQSGMARFIENLASLDSSDLEKFLQKTNQDDPGRLLAWENGRPVNVDPSALDERLAKYEAQIHGRIRQAERSLMSPGDLNRFETREGEDREVVALIHDAYWRHTDALETRLESTTKIYEGILNLNSILIIGRCSSPFFLQIDEAGGVARICVNIRTAEERVDNGEPSYNGLWIPISVISAKSLADQHAKHGSPRLKITRVVSLNDIELGDGDRLGYPQFFAFEYPGWFELRGTSSWASGLEKHAPRIWAGLVELVRRRLVENAFSEVERLYLASGRRVIEQIHAWATNSAEWTAGDVAYDLTSWPSHLARLAKRVLESDARGLDRQAAAAAMLTAVYGDSPFTAGLINHSFLRLLARHIAMTEQFANAFYETGRTATASIFLDQSHNLLGAAGEPLFVKSTFGWDVRPAKQHRRT